MVGRTDSTDNMVHREIPRVLVLRSLATTRCSEHCSGALSLDNAFALIEGHPNAEEKKGFTGRRRGPKVVQVVRMNEEKSKSPGAKRAPGAPGSWQSDK